MPKLAKAGSRIETLNIELAHWLWCKQGDYSTYFEKKVVISISPVKQIQTILYRLEFLAVTVKEELEMAHDDNSSRPHGRVFTMPLI